MAVPFLMGLLPEAAVVIHSLKRESVVTVWPSAETVMLMPSNEELPPTLVPLVLTGRRTSASGATMI